MHTRTTTSKRILACGAALGGLLEAGATQAATAAESEPVQLEEVVVTANKRIENVQDVDASVSVITSADIQRENLGQLSDYVAGVPGVTVNSFGSPGQTSITIRGIAKLSGGSKVATYIDETPLGSSGIWADASSFQLDLMPFDLERVEVLRGPQGTLYGASSMGGLLKYVLRAPNTDKFETEAGIDVAAIESGAGVATTYEGRVNIPVVKDVLAVSGSLSYSKSPGYIDNTYTGARNTNSFDQYGGRLAALWQASETLSVKLNALWQRVNSDDDAQISIVNPTTTVQPDGSVLIHGGTSLGRLNEAKAFLAPFKNDVDFYSSTVTWNPGPVEFVSATSWSRTRVTHVADNSIDYGTLLPLVGLPAGLVQSTLLLGLDKFTQEFRVTSPKADRVAWMAGAFFSHEQQSQQQLISAFDTNYVPIPELAPYAGYLTIPTTYRELAAFGNATWTVTSRFDITAGLRYAQNKQTFVLGGSGLLAGLPQTPVTYQSPVDSREGKTTWMGSSRYHFSEDLMGYVRVATGYAPGGANSPQPGVPQTVGSETLTTYELGLKSELLARRVLLDVSGYHIDWKDIQLPATLNGIGYTENGGKASTDGFELTASYSPIQQLTLELNTGYAKAELKSYAANVATPYVLDTQLAQVPKWTASGKVDYNWYLPADWTATFGGTVRWVDDQYSAEKVVGQQYYVLPCSTVVGLNASFTKNDVTFRAYVKNLTNALAPQSEYSDTDATGVTRQIDVAILQPRTLGAGVVVRF